MHRRIGPSAAIGVQNTKKQSIKLAHRIQTRSSQYVASPPWTKQVCHGYGEPHGDTHGYGYVDRNSVPTAALERSNDVHRKHLKYFELIRRAVHISFKVSGWNLMQTGVASHQKILTSASRKYGTFCVPKDPSPEIRDVPGNTRRLATIVTVRGTLYK